jgi:hypothetical protein
MGNKKCRERAGTGNSEYMSEGVMGGDVDKSQSK